MTTQIEDSELNTELQELYLESKQWISDLEFLQTDLEFIKRLLVKGGDNSEKLIETANIQDRILQLESSIAEFMQQLELLIIQEVQHLGMKLLETYTKLLYRKEGILQAFNTLRGTVFALNKN
jgi:hypothetical protein